MSVATSHTNINPHPSLVNARPRSRSPYSPHSTPLPVSSASSYTSHDASDEQSITFSNSSPENRNGENEGAFNSQEVQGQNHDREEQDVNTEAAAAAATQAATTVDRSTIEINRNSNQQQIATSETPTAEATDTIRHATQASAPEANGIAIALADVLNEASVPTAVSLTHARTTDDVSSSTLPELQEESAGIDTVTLSDNSSNTNNNEARPANQTRQADEAGSIEQEAISQRHHDTDEENEDNEAVANNEVDNEENEEGNDESDSSDDEGDTSSWRYIERPEDTSSPDEEELKEIEEAGESSANDESYWNSELSEYLQDPEYTAGPSGCLYWLLEGLDGTKDKPNKKLLMRSPKTAIGGYEWQIKFYPRGNATSYLSVYVECVDMLNKKDESRLSSNEENPHEVSDRKAESTEDTDSPDISNGDNIDRDTKPARQLIDTPIPYLQGSSLTKPSSVVAVMTVVLYNPEEPRVNQHRTLVHRFSPGSPDWGWKRFYGPHKSIHRRQRGERQALLCNDKLAFKVYTRLIHDPTGCLGQHESDDDQPWNSLSMTGIRSLTLRDYEFPPSDSHYVCALSSWLMLKPFRQFLYNLDVVNPYERPRERPMPFIVSLLKLLYLWRMPMKHKQNFICLGNVINAISWNGLDGSFQISDVIDAWVVFRTALEIEMNGSPSPSSSSLFPSSPAISAGMKRLGNLLGCRRSPVTGSPSYRIPVKGVHSIQEGIDRSENSLTKGDSLPELLPIELERQTFNNTTRVWKKIVDRVEIQEKVKVRNAEYLLYGMVVHEGELRSGKFHSVLRPRGLDGKWYKFSSDDDGGRVTCLTRKEAITAHEGFSRATDDEKNDVEADETSPVAYIVMYLRSDVATEAFGSDEEPWDVPNWLLESIEEDKREEIDDGDDNNDDEAYNRGNADNLSAIRSQASRDPEAKLKAETGEDITEEGSKELEVQIIDSRIFLSHEGYGNFNPSDPRLATTAEKISSPYIHSIKLRSNATVDDIANILVDIIEDVECKRQCRFWAMRSYAYANKNPSFIDPERSLKKNYLSERTERRFWVHITPTSELPPLPAGGADMATDGKDEDGLQIDTQDGSHSQLATAEVVNITDQNSSGLAGLQALSREPNGHNNDTYNMITNNSDESHTSQQNQRGVPLLTERTVSNVDVDPPATSLSILSSNLDLSMNEPAESQNIRANRSEPAPTADSRDNNHDAVSQVSVNDGTNHQANSDRLREDDAAALPSNNEIDVQDTDSNQIQDNAAQDTSNKPIKALEDIYLFLKIFDQEAQKLIPWGSFITPVTSQISKVIQNKLGLPDCKDMSLWEEHRRGGAYNLKKDSTFAEEGLDGTGIIIIYQKTLSEERITALANRADFYEVESYLQYLRDLEVKPDCINGLITTVGFASVLYSVNVKNNQMHGHGHTISLSGDEYIGEFRVDECHGLGRMIYANGDEYYGYWVDGARHGQGRFVEAATGNTYVGEWRRDRQHGEGVTTWKMADVSERLCRICWDASADSAIYDCGHVVACLECAKQVDNCPVCRRRVIGAMKLFYVT